MSRRYSSTDFTRDEVIVRKLIAELSRMFFFFFFRESNEYNVCGFARLRFPYYLHVFEAGCDEQMLPVPTAGLKTFQLGS